jgi:uncharacterized membrane protein
VSFYEFLLAVHVLAAAAWVGGALVLLYADRRVARATPERLAEHMELEDHIGVRFFVPATLILLLAGIGLVIDGEWSLGEPFVSAGLAVWLLSFLTGVAYFAPEGPKIGALIAAEGPTSPAVRARVNRLHLVSAIEAAALVAIVVLMVVKPGT